MLHVRDISGGCMFNCSHIWSNYMVHIGKSSLLLENLAYTNLKEANLLSGYWISECGLVIL